MGLLLTGGKVVVPQENTQKEWDILIENGVITAMGSSLMQTGHTVRKVQGYILPGLIDVHVHLREPGQVHKETIESGTHAAAAGGFTQICAMPNTIPVLDTPELIREVIVKAQQFGYATVHPIAAITRSEKGEELTDFPALKKAGAVALSDDGRGVQSANMMFQALLRATPLHLPVAVHAEDNSLAAGGHMHAGKVAQELGVQGIPGVAETSMIARDMWLAQEAKAHLHLCHVSPAAAVAAIRQGKALGLPITAEVTPHHLLLTEEAVREWGANAKVNPPLRSEADRLACIQGLLDGTLDLVATDHAPHTQAEKAKGLEAAPFGLVGLETSFPLLYTAFVKSGILTLPELVYKMSTRPAQVFHLAGGTLEIGGVADLTIIDPDTVQSVDPESFYSQGRNTPFAGRELVGWPVMTIHKGQVVYER